MDDSSSDLTAVFQSCIAAFNRGDLQGAEDALGRLLSQGLEDPILAYLQGILNLRRRNWADAERDLRNALQRDPGRSYILLDLAQTLRAQGRAGEAIALCHEALGDAAQHLAARIELAKALDDAGEWVEAEQHYRQLLTMPEAHDFAILNLATLLNRSYRAAEAEELLTPVLAGP